MKNGIYGDLRAWIGGREGFDELLPLLDDSEQILSGSSHGDMPRWRKALKQLPAPVPCFDGALPAPRLGHPVEDRDGLRRSLMELHPWRKGPLNVAGVHVDTEWRSDWKWDRLAPHVSMSGHAVLDVGCGNGYYGWRMLGAGADCVVGLDPTLVFVMQWLACRSFAGRVDNYVLPLGIEHLAPETRRFDTVFSMGVLYHRRDAVAHLQQLVAQVRPGGQIVLETLVLEGPGEDELIPDGRFARMRNVWSIPTVARLRRWLDLAGLPAGRLLDVTPTRLDEQRSTEWMRFESLSHSLDASDPARTVEGYPAPVRAILLIRVPA